MKAFTAYIHQFINKVRRRPEYIFYSVFGLFVVVAVMLAFWPKSAEDPFKTFIPGQNAGNATPPGGVAFELIRTYSHSSLKKPTSVYADDKRVYITDVAANTITIINKSGKTLAVIKGTGKAQKKPLNYPNAVAPLDDSRVIISESGNRRLLIYTKDSAFVKAIDLSEGTIKKPGFITAHQGKIYVADLEAYDIKILDEKANIIGSIAAPINEVPILKYPQGMDYDKDGNLWVADGGNERIVAFDSKGGYIRSFKGSENGGTGFAMVKGLAIVNGSLLCVSDPMSGNVRVFDIAKNLKEVARLEDFIYPMGLFTDDKNNLFVADRGNSRVQQFGVK